MKDARSYENQPVSRRDFLSAAALGAAALAMTGRGARTVEAATSPKRPPSFIIVFADDLAYGDLSCYGAQGYTTPNLDRMAAEGMQFTDFYSAAPICTPSRAALMTGCYPQRVNLPSVLGPNSNVGISADETTMAEMLKAGGYATACVGKWHLGDRPEFLPTRHGFDSYFGLPYSNDMWPNHPTAKNYPDLPLMEGEEVIERNPDQTQLTTRYTERAVEFIRENSERPFFLYLAHSMPHVPLFVSDKFAGKTERGLFGDVISEIDWSVGQILDTLEELGIDDNTFIMFTSDNGPWLSYGDHAGSALPLREGKHTTFDGGHREPCIMRWPGAIPAGETCTELCVTFDMLPTFAGLAGVDAPAPERIDGRDIWPLISGEAGATTPHDAFYYYLRNDLQAVRSGPWKLHLPHKYHDIVEPGRDGLPGKQEERPIELSLFNLRDDISETTNLAEQHPDIVERMSAMATVFDEQMKATARPCGKVATAK